MRHPDSTHGTPPDTRTPPGEIVKLPTHRDGKRHSWTRWAWYDDRAYCQTGTGVEPPVPGRQWRECMGCGLRQDKTTDVDDDPVEWPKWSRWARF